MVFLITYIIGVFLNGKNDWLMEHEQKCKGGGGNNLCPSPPSLFGCEEGTRQGGLRELTAEERAR